MKNMNKIFISAIAILLTAYACNMKQEKEPLKISSPDDALTINFYLGENGEPGYAATFKEKVVVDSSALGFELVDGRSLASGFTVINSSNNSYDNTWEQPWGEERLIRNNYNELKIEMENKEGLQMNLFFRAYNGGLAFRYEFPEQENLDKFEIADERTEFNMSDNHLAWWIPAFAGNRYEYIYKKSPINTLEKVHTPLTIETKDGLYLSIHEAALIDFSSMVIESTGNNRLKCSLVPWSTTNDLKAYVDAPFKTPWRTVQVEEKPGELITNYMILNLNEPNKLEDVSWIKPGKYVGVWWEMHINEGTWNQGPKHSANTANTKKYIDFAAKHGFDGVLVEGWNYGWDGPWMNGGTEFNFTRPYPDYDIEALSEYAKDKGVYIIGHHETGADIENYGEQLEEAFQFLEDHGMKAVKTGYVENGDTLPSGHYHHGQYYVRHFREVIKTAADHHVMVVAHEPIKGTGERRTFPNMMSREGARGQEYNAWSPDGGNPPSHVTIVPFTRSLAGPFDYTPGVFDIKLPTQPNNQINGTLAKELALYVIVYAPMQMACDLPRNYEGHPAFQFIKDVATDWETTKVLEAKIGDYVTIARQQRGQDKWFVGAITDENPRSTSLKLDFLTPGKTYKATIYKDAPDAHYIDNPTAYKIEETGVNSESVISLDLAASGGAAISLLIPVE